MLAGFSRCLDLEHAWRTATRVDHGLCDPRPGKAGFSRDNDRLYRNGLKFNLKLVFG
jgi:hypothetical protein